jgi:hypothetical protein
MSGPLVSASAANRAALGCERDSARRRHRPESSGQVRRSGGYPRDEPADRSRGPEDMDLGVTGVGGDRLQEQRTASPAIGEQPPPGVSALPGPAHRPPCAAGRGEVQEHDGVRGLRPDSEDVIGPEVPSMIHDSCAVGPRWTAAHSARGVAVRPGRQKSLSARSPGGS